MPWNMVGCAIALATVLSLSGALASTALAKNGGPPKIDIEYGCHASEQAVKAVLSVTSDIYTSCVDSEKGALEQLDKSWSTFPASDKAQCIHPKEYIPGYVEWLTCLEMTRDVRVMRKGQPENTSTDIHECPVVRFHEDGTIISVNTAC
jgi:hypothetical protein